MSRDNQYLNHFACNGGSATWRRISTIHFRPMYQQSHRSEDELTRALADIVKVNNKIKRVKNMKKTSGDPLKVHKCKLTKVIDLAL